MRLGEDAVPGRVDQGGGHVGELGAARAGPAAGGDVVAGRAREKGLGVGLRRRFTAGLRQLPVGDDVLGGARPVELGTDPDDVAGLAEGGNDPGDAVEEARRLGHAQVAGGFDKVVLQVDDEQSLAGLELRSLEVRNAVGQLAGGEHDGLWDQALSGTVCE